MDNNSVFDFYDDKFQGDLFGEAAQGFMANVWASNSPKKLSSSATSSMQSLSPPPTPTFASADINRFEQHVAIEIAMPTVLTFDYSHKKQQDIIPLSIMLPERKNKLLTEKEIQESKIAERKEKNRISAQRSRLTKKIEKNRLIKIIQDSSKALKTLLQTHAEGISPGVKTQLNKIYYDLKEQSDKHQIDENVELELQKFEEAQEGKTVVIPTHPKPRKNS